MQQFTATEIEIAVANKLDYRKNIIVPNISWGANFNHECDLLVINMKTYHCTEVEIKISKSDLKADLHKWHGHSSNRIKYLYFAIPINLLPTAEEILPDTTGIITVEKFVRGINDGHFYDPYTHTETHIYRRAKVNPNSKLRALTEKEVVNITRLGCMRIWKLKGQLKRRGKRKKIRIEQPELFK